MVRTLLCEVKQMGTRASLIFVIVVALAGSVVLLKDTRPKPGEKGIVTASASNIPIVEPRHEDSRVVGNWIWLNPMGGVRIVLNADRTGTISGGPDASFTWEAQGDSGFRAIVNWKDQTFDRTSRFFGKLSSNGNLITNWTVFGFGKDLSTTFEPSNSAPESFQVKPSKADDPPLEVRQQTVQVSHCQENLVKARLSLQVFINANGRKPNSLDELSRSQSGIVTSCDAEGLVYGYNSSTGTISCRRPGHESY